MPEIDPSRAEWHKSSFSSQSGNCVEVARNLPGLAAVRDSKSPDAPNLLVSPDAMHQLAISCPDLPVKQARQRWAAYVDREADLDLLDGDALLHTDFNPLNILLDPDRTWIIDWAWPTRGAAFIDAACFLIRAMTAGHSASQGEALAATCPGWQHAPSAAIDVFALASARLYTEIVRNDPQPFKQRLAAAAHEWACHRLGTSSSLSLG
jgi:Ser/Thr protein kinase RdoA (MazF antagonist)